MAYTYHGTRDLITSPGRSVQTFPSGLVRVERTYICRRGDEARYRSELAVGNLLPDDEGTPAIDGLYIYPDPQEQTKDSGFTEFRVTAYGRTNTTGYQNIIADRRIDIFKTYYYTGNYAGFGVAYGGLGTSNYEYEIIVKKISRTCVLNRDEIASFYNSLNTPVENGILALRVVTINTSEPNSVTLDYSGIKTFYGIETSNSLNFGVFTEFVVGFAPNFDGSIIYKAK